MYNLCVGRGWVTPVEFWQMPPEELWWLVDAMMPAAEQMSEADNLELYNLLMSAKAEDAARTTDG